MKEINENKVQIEKAEEKLSSYSRLLDQIKPKGLTENFALVKQLQDKMANAESLFKQREIVALHDLEKYKGEVAEFKKLITETKDFSLENPLTEQQSQKDIELKYLKKSHEQLTGEPETGVSRMATQSRNLHDLKSIIDGIDPSIEQDLQDYHTNKAVLENEEYETIQM